jgi:hypothetical protein
MRSSARSAGGGLDCFQELLVHVREIGGLMDDYAL